MKLLNVILILLFAYLIFIALFTNKTSVCEPLIDLDASQNNVNQSITYKDNDGNEYVMLRLEDIKNIDGQPDKSLISQIYGKIAQSIPNYETLSEQNSVVTQESLLTSQTQLIREPILAIKKSDIAKLAQNNVLSAAVRIVGNRQILIPHSSVLRGQTVYGEKISNRIISADTILFLDYISKMPASIDDLKYLYLEEIHEHDGIKINVLRINGDVSKKVSLL